MIHVIMPGCVLQNTFAIENSVTLDPLAKQIETVQEIQFVIKIVVEGKNYVPKYLFSIPHLKIHVQMDFIALKECVKLLYLVQELVSVPKVIFVEMEYVFFNQFV